MLALMEFQHSERAGPVTFLGPGQGRPMTFPVPLGMTFWSADPGMAMPCNLTGGAGMW